MRFAVIGAGAGGLCAAKHLLSRGIAITIYEFGSKVGGLWVYNNDSGLSPAYRSLHINSEAIASAYRDFPFPDGSPLYPDHVEMQRYLQAYAERFDLMRHIRFKSQVTSVMPLQPNGFEVVLADGTKERHDGVVIATGHQSRPRHPDYAKKFTGEYLHAHSYRVPEPFAGKRVLVIGTGNSAVDIAADVCLFTASTMMAARSPVLIMPRMMFGVPNSRILMKIEKPFVPWRIRIRARTFLTWIFHGRMEQWGFITPKTRTHPISHPTLMAHFAWRRISAKPGVSDVTGTTVHFADGSSEIFDTIIAATGYHTEFPFLPEGLSPVDGTRLSLFKRVVHPHCPGLYFIGFFDVSGGSNIRMMDDQSEFVAAIASGALELPDQASMLADIERDHRWSARQFPNSPRYGLELDPRRYRQGLAREYRRSRAAAPA